MALVKFLCFHRVIQHGAALLLASHLVNTAQAAIISEGTVVIPGTYVFDFDAGGGLSDFAAADVWWEQINSTSRVLMPWTSASSLAYIGQVGVAGLSFNDLTVTDLEALTYTSNGIPGGDAVDLLSASSVFAVKTNLGNYAKVLVTFPFFQAYQNNGLGIYWVTYAPTTPVPENDMYSMMLAGLGLMHLLARRRSV